MRSYLPVVLTCGLCAAQVRPTNVVPEPTTTSLPANLPAHPVGPNDLLVVSVYDSPDLSRSIRVGADGNIRFPMLKQPIEAAGLLPADLENVIAAALVEYHILVDPVVTVSIAEYHSRPISVAGAVRTPVTFQAVGPMTLLEAIARAGGVEKDAGADIFLTRSQPANGGARQTTERIPVKALVNATDPRGSLQLTGGEEIRIPEAGRIFVAGNVKKPGTFTAPEATDATVIKAVALAEGLLPFSANQAYIYRPAPSGVKTEIAIDLRRILDRKSPDIALQAEDVLYVPDNSHKRLGAAALERILVFGSTAGATALIYGR
jgi:polysaccharide export outer membrane protein